MSPRSAAGSQDYSDHAEEPEGSWTNVYPDEIGPSDSASRPRTSNQQRPLVEAPQPQEARRPLYRRHITQERPRNLPQPRAHRAPPSESESVDSHEERWAYAQSPPQQYGHHYARFAAAPPGYPSPHAYQQYTAPSAVAPGQQQMVPYGFSAYQQHAPPPGPAPGYFGHHGVPSHEMMPHNPHPGFYSYPPQQQGFPMPVSPPPAMYPPYPLMYPPAPPVAAPAPVPTPAPPAAPADPPPAAASPQPPLDSSRDDEKFARLEKLFLDEKADRDAREAAAAKALADAEAKAKADKEKAEEIAAASSAAAAAAKAEAQQEYKDATEKANAEAAAAEAAAAAAAAAAPPPPPKEKDKPIKFKDAIGRRFNFPFHMCNTWTVSDSFQPWTRNWALSNDSLLGHGVPNQGGFPSRGKLRPARS